MCPNRDKLVRRGASVWAGDMCLYWCACSGGCLNVQRSSWLVARLFATYSLIQINNETLCSAYSLK